MLLSVGTGLWVLVVALALIYLGAHLHAQRRRIEEARARIVRSIVVPSRDAHLAEKPRGE